MTDALFAVNMMKTDILLDVVIEEKFGASVTLDFEEHFGATSDTFIMRVKKNYSEN